MTATDLVPAVLSWLSTSLLNGSGMASKTKTESGPNADPSGMRILYVIGPLEIGGAERQFGQSLAPVKRGGWGASSCCTGRLGLQFPELAGDQERAQGMGAAGCWNMRQQFTPDHSGDEYEALYQFPQTGSAMMVPSRMDPERPTPGRASQYAGRGRRGECRHCLDGKPR